MRILSRPPHPTLIQNNRWFHSLLTDGVEVEYREAKSGETRGGRARLVDFDNPGANDLLVVRQLTVTGASGKVIRPDLTVFLNGLPVAVIELKAPTDTQANLGAAIDQLDRYTQTAPDLFVSNLALVVSDGIQTRVGSITSVRSRFMPWRPIDDREGVGAPTLEALIRVLFDLRMLVDYLRTCVTFEEDERGEIAKKIAGYHQFRAVRKARASVLARLKPPSGTGDGRGGVIWHTQGSGKSLTMLMLAGGLIRELRMTNPTIVMITDRNDLDDQLFDTFAAGRALLRQDPVQTVSREHLKALLDRAAGGVVFTTIQKFAEAHGAVSERLNVVVMADEAHRSQYGFVEGGARWMREALPNATLPTPRAGGLLLFGLKPNRFLPQAGISAVAYSGTKKDYGAKARAALRGPAVSLFPAPPDAPGQPLYPLLPRTFSEAGTAVEAGVIEQALDFVHRNIEVTAWIENGGRRLERWDYPLEAVREALTNAVAHRDYTITVTDIELSIYSDRIEIISPGRLPNTVTVSWPSITARPHASGSMPPSAGPASRPWSRSARASANASGASATAWPVGCGCVTTTGRTTWPTIFNRSSRSSASKAPRASCGSPKATASRSASSAR